jgi:hypothetical protein
VVVVVVVATMCWHSWCVSVYVCVCVCVVVMMAVSLVVGRCDRCLVRIHVRESVWTAFTHQISSFQVALVARPQQVNVYRKRHHRHD